MKTRTSGVLLHISSLPSPFGIGDMGPGAYRFADFLANAGQRYWQILPLNPTELTHHNSPYYSNSTFALNPLLISPELLVEQGFLEKQDLKPIPKFSQKRVRYAEVAAYKEMILDKAYDKFKTGNGIREAVTFLGRHQNWLNDYALFAALCNECRAKAWSEWTHDLRDRDPHAIRTAEKELSKPIEKVRFIQTLCHHQWMQLKSYCNEKKIQIMGDLPIYVQFNSADVWTHPGYFKLDHRMRPSVVAGVPPDYFSETGQLWGNPVYRWDVLKQNGYDWWIERISYNLHLFDVLRIDHFRGIVSAWEVPANEKDARGGKWVRGPGADLFHNILKKIPDAPIIAEDLGYITPDVTEVMNRLGFPGMKVLLFAFGDDQPASVHSPHNLDRNCVIYTGTHDNNTVKGWFKQEADPETRKRLSLYLGRRVTPRKAPRELVRLALMSVAETCVLPMQDLLGLGERARMNQPARVEGNWQWRLTPRQLSASLEARLRNMTRLYGRCDMPKKTAQPRF